jgi:hypothetical protein
MDIAAGEYGYDASYFQRMLKPVVDVLQSTQRAAAESLVRKLRNG